MNSSCPARGAAARTGVLLVHGLTGTPAEMRLLAKGLNKQGFTVYAVQLAGHCGSMEDLVDTRWTDWLASVEAGLQRLSQHMDHVVVGGLSMGAVLSLAVAQRHPDKVDGVCALSTTFRYDGWSIPFYTRLAFLLPLFRALGIGRHSVFMEQPPYGIKDEALRARVVEQMHSGDSAAAGLPGNPWWSIIELRRLSAHVLARLPQLRSPCLVIHARNDDISSVANAHDIVHGASQAHVELVLLDKQLPHGHHRPRPPHRDRAHHRIRGAHRQRCRPPRGAGCGGRTAWAVISRRWSSRCGC